MKLSFLLLLSCLLGTVLTGCSSKESQLVQHYQDDPFQAQKDARPCAEKLFKQESIRFNATCQAILKFQGPRCQEKQDAGALLYRGYDCRDEKQLIWMTLEGN